MSNNTLFTFLSKEELHINLCEEIVNALNKGITEDGSALIAVSGGSTPKPLFEKLSLVDIPWEKVIITLVDERWVDNDHKESNEKLVKDHLMQNNAAKAKFIPLKYDLDTPFDAISRCSEEFKDIKNTLDVVILGMGTDGHTASFFPKDVNLENALNTKEICAATIPSDAPHQRMTLSLNKLLKAKNLFLHIEGEAKKEVYDNALSDGAIEDMPIRAVLRDNKNLEVYYAK